MKNHPWKSERPVDDEVIHVVTQEPDPEDQWIIKMTKRSAKLLLLIGLLFSSEHLLPTKAEESPIIEFIYEGNELTRAKTETREFRVAPEHMHPRQFGEGNVILHVGPIMSQVRHYTLENEAHELEHSPHFSAHQYAYLMYLVLIFALIQLMFTLKSFPRFAMWVTSIGCILAYLAAYLSSTL